MSVSSVLGTHEVLREQTYLLEVDVQWFLTTNSGSTKDFVKLDSWITR